jgi:hypothetical protein
MKIRVWCDSGANAFSCKSEVVDLADVGVTEEEWVKLSDEDKEATVKDVALSTLEWGFEEVP